MGEFKHWCGNCQIRIHIQWHYGRRLTWQDCPYVCEYDAEMKAISDDMRGEEDDLISRQVVIDALENTKEVAK